MAVDNAPCMDELLAKTPRIRTSAGVAQRVLRLVENPDFDVQQVVRILETDPALATQILRLVNSSYFGLPRRVASLQQAICLLGVHTLRLALLNYGVLQCLSQSLPGPRRDEFLRHSLTVATVAEKLVKQQGDAGADEAYCAGLVVDIGVLAFAQAARARYEPLLLNHPMGVELLEAERDCFGFDHAQLGARMLTHWNLPEAIVDAVAKHHEHPRGPVTSVTPIQIAEQVAGVLWTRQSSAVTSVRELLASYYDFSVDDFIQLAIDCKQSLSQSAAAFNVTIRDEIDVEDLRSQAMELFVSASVATAVELDGLNSLVENPLPPVW